MTNKVENNGEYNSKLSILNNKLSELDDNINYNDDDDDLNDDLNDKKNEEEDIWGIFEKVQTESKFNSGSNSIEIIESDNDEFSEFTEFTEFIEFTELEPEKLFFFKLLIGLNCFCNFSEFNTNSTNINFSLLFP
jgi:hypothetical protein